MYHIIADRFRGKISREDLERLEQWLQKTEQNRQIYADLEKVWLLTGALEQPFKGHTDKEWDKFVLLREAAEKSNVTGRKISFNKVLRYAAVIIPFIVLATGYVIYQKYHTQVFLTVSSGNQQKHVILSDGSDVWLNKFTTLRYANISGNENRKVYLNGEAFFEVKKTGGHFTVFTGSASVRVLGTRFNVRSKEDSKQTQVFVEEGKVRFAENSLNYVELIAGEKAIYKGNHTPIVKAGTTGNATAWMKKRLVFSDNTLSEVVDDLESYFNVTIIVSSGMESCLFSGEFSDPVLENVVEVIALSTGSSIKYENRIIHLEGSGCNE